MIIYIDGLFYKRSGIRRYYESLVKEFTKRDIKIYTCVLKSLRKEFEKDFEVTKNLKPIWVNYKRFSPKGFVHQSIVLKRLEKRS
ncbi:MAG: hypothetical protein ACP5UF_06795 [Hydrogenobaculum sp.]